MSQDTADVGPAPKRGAIPPSPALGGTDLGPARGIRPAVPGPLRPHLPTELSISPVGRAFYEDSFRFRTLMREAPEVLVAEARRSRSGSSDGARPLRAWDPAFPTLREAAISPAPDHEPQEGERAGFLPAPRPAPPPITASSDPLPSLRPEAPLRSLRWAADPTLRTPSADASRA